MTSTLQRGTPQKNGAGLDISKLSRRELEQLVQTSGQLLREMAERLAAPLVLLDDRISSQTKFVEISGALVKATVTCQSPLIVYDPASNELIHSPATATLDVSLCREGDLLNAMAVVKDGNAKVQLRKWCEKLRQADEPKAQAPLQVEILNPEKIGATPKVITVKRNDSGQLTAAVSQPIN